MKYTKANAQACYDGFFGVLHCLNGGTQEENRRSAARCREELLPYIARAKTIAENPTKLLKADAWLMEVMTIDLPRRFAAFEKQYPAAGADVHSPGPWVCGFTDKDGDTFDTQHIFDPSEFEVAMAFLPSVQSPYAVREANARLIAAAPELLAAVKSLLPLAAHTSPEDVAIHAARAVIEKVERSGVLV